MPWEKKEKKKEPSFKMAANYHFFRSVFWLLLWRGFTSSAAAVREEKRLITAQQRRHDTEMLSPARVIIKTQKAVIFRKCIQRALHMNEFMNKNDVVASDLCRRGGGDGDGRGGRRVAAPWNKRSGWFTEGQGIITWRKGSSTGGPRNAFSGA